jgi:class 3 adenylate cyclase
MRGFSPGRIVERSILRALREGERLLTAARLALALGLASTWPLTAWLEPAIAPRQRVLALVSLAIGAASVAALWWLRRRTPDWRFSALSVALDFAMVTGILVVIMLWGGPWYQGLPTVVGMPAVALVVAASGLRLSRHTAIVGIALGWGVTVALLGVDLARIEGAYPASSSSLLGVALNLLGASLICWAMSSRTRAWIDEAASLAVVATRAAQRLGAYLPRAQAEATLARVAPVRDAQRATLAVLFTRLRALPESAAGDGSRVVAELNEYFEAISASVHAAGGVIDKYRHDGVMAVFGAGSLRAGDHDAAWCAVTAAGTMQAALEQLNQRRCHSGREPLAHGIGIHYGPVALGHIGTKDRLAYTAIGDAVNVAARLAALAGELGETILISDATLQSAQRHTSGRAAPQFRALGEHLLRGRRAPVRLHVAERRDGTLPPPAARPRQASWDELPSSELVADAWNKAPLVSARAVAREGGSVVQAVLERAALDGERWVAWVRLGVGATAVVLALQLTAADNREFGSIATAIVGLVAVAGSVAILLAVERANAGRSRIALLAGTLDVSVVSVALLAFMTWRSEHYRGLSHLSGLGLIYLVILASGIRLKRRNVAFVTALAALATSVLLVIDQRAGHPASALDLASVALMLGGSGLLAYAAVVRSKRLVAAVVRQARDAVRARERLGAYVSDAVAEHALESDQLMLGGRRLERVAVVACDLRGFTRYAEELALEELVAQLNDYFEAMAEPIREQQGVIDSFVGDAVLVVFGAPKPNPHAALRALRAAAGMRSALERHNAERASRNLPPLVHGIGVQIGPAIAGHIGTEDRATFTLVGPVMIEAEALERATKEHDRTVVISEAALAAARAEANGQALPETTALGPVELGPGGRRIDAHALR